MVKVGGKFGKEGEPCIDVNFFILYIFIFLPLLMPAFVFFF